MYHEPVMINECIKGLAIKPDGIYVDVTYGSGGHSKEILKKLTKGKLFAFDQDDDAIRNKIEDERLTLIHQNFRYMKNFLKLYKTVPVDGIIADLGVSSHQLDVAERGFSTRFDGELDLRMDRKKRLSAREVVNNYSERQLREIFFKYGEIKNALKLAAIIEKSRRESEIKTTSHLKDIISICAKRGRENKYYAQVFQALRIEVNNELEILKVMLGQTVEVLKQGGRLVVISYHSLEDRLVKNFLKSGNFKGEIEKDFYGNPIVNFKLINKKPIIPNEEEIKRNNRSRSAKLRIAEKI